MKRFLLILAAVGMVFTACEENGGIEEENGQKDPTEQPGNGENGGENGDNQGGENGGNQGGENGGNQGGENGDNQGGENGGNQGGENGGNQGGENGDKDDVEIPADKTQSIKFQDEATKHLCTLHWDENEDGELSYEEAAAITDLDTAFKGSSIMAFTELKYFIGLAEIAGNAFEDCVSLVKITLPEQITTIGISAFEDCTNLKKIEIPDSVTSIGDWAFYDCTSLARVDISDLSAWCKIGFGSGANPLRNGAKLYLDNNEITELVIPSDITEIKNDAFEGCTNLKKIEIPDSVTSIGNDAFENCTSLTSVTIPDSVTSIGKYAFSDCSSLTSVTIGHSVTSIGNSAFRDCSSLTSVTIPDSVTSIGSYAFYRCSSLTAIYGKYASADKRCLIIDGVLNSFAPAGLTSYTIPDSVTSIEMSAFEGCSSLISISIPDSVTSIGRSAFRGCSSLTSVTIPDSVTSIGNWAFFGCTGELIINSKIIETDYTYNNYPAESNDGWLDNSKFTKLTIGNNITKIGSYAFYYCDRLTSVTIPDSVTSIGERAFQFCSSLTSVTIGKSVTRIEGYAFDDCSSLKNVYCKPTTPPTGTSGMFHSNASGRKIYVPTASVNAYKSDLFWRDYASDIVGYDF